MDFQFKTYSRDELFKCGSALKACLAETMNESDGAAKWTETIMEWFFKARASGVEVVGRPFTSERQFDQSHVDPMARGLLAALESEWGVYGQIKRGREEILKDAEKLANVTARTKIMVFGPNGSDDREFIVGELKQIRERHLDKTPWLWFSVSWEYDGKHLEQIQYGIFG